MLDDFELSFVVDNIKVEPSEELNTRKIDINGCALYFDNFKSKRDCLIQPFDINILHAIHNDGIHKNDILKIEVKPIVINFSNLQYKYFS